MQLSKAFRVKGDGVRRVYFAARRAERYLRDAPRRAVLRALPPSFTLSPDAGFLVEPPARFEESAAVVAHAREALARFDASNPPEGKNRKRFLQNVADSSTFGLDAPPMRLALREDVLAAASGRL